MADILNLLHKHLASKCTEELERLEPSKLPDMVHQEATQQFVAKLENIIPKAT